MTTPTASLVFNNGIKKTGNITPTYTRDGIAYVNGGQIAANDFLPGRTTLNASPRSAWTEGYTFTGASRWIGAGFLHNNTDEAFAFMEANGDCKVFESDLVTPTRTNALVSGGNFDVLKGTVSGYQYNPRAGICFHGLWVMVCEAINTVDSDVEYAATCITQDQFATTPTLLGDWDELGGDATHHGSERGREWVIEITVLEGSPQSPTKIVVTMVDYMHAPNKVGGQCYAFLAERSTPTGTWTTGTLTKVYESTTVEVGLHFHDGCYNPDTGKFEVCIGDATGDNAIIFVTPTDGIDNLATTAFTTETVHGTQGSSSRMGGQFVKAIHRGDGTFLRGGDVQDAGIYACTATDDGIDITRVYGHATAAGDVYESLFAESRTEHGPCVWRHNIFSGDTPNANTRRVLYSPDMRHFVSIGKGDATLPAYFPFIFKGKIGMLSTAKVEYMDQPTVSRFKPLRVGGGYTNLLRSTDYDVLGVGAGNTGELVLASSVTPAPPTGNSKIIHVAGGSTAITLGRYRLTSGSAVATGDVTVLVWVKALKDQAAPIRLFVGNGTTFATPATNVHMPVNTEWSPVLVRGDVAAVGDYDLQLQVESGATSGPLVDYHIAPAAVIQGDVAVSYAGAVAASVPATTLEADVTLGANWTVVMDCVVSEHGFDSSRADAGNWLMSVVKDLSNAQVVYANTIANRLQQLSRVAATSATTHSADGSAYFVPGDLIRCSLKYDGTTYTAHAIVNGNDAISTTGTAAASGVTGEVTIKLASNRTSDGFAPLDVLQVGVYDEALTEAEIEALPASLETVESETNTMKIRGTFNSGSTGSTLNISFTTDAPAVASAAYMTILPTTGPLIGRPYRIKSLTDNGGGNYTATIFGELPSGVSPASGNTFEMGFVSEQIDDHAPR